MLWCSSAFCLCTFTLRSVLPALTAHSSLKCASKHWDSIQCVGIPLPAEKHKSLHSGSHVFHVQWGGGWRWGRREPCLGVFSWPKRCWRNLQWYLSGFPFACLLFFFFFWLSCSSLLIYCICSRGFGKGGSEGVLLPKGKGAGRRSYFTSQVM